MTSEFKLFRKQLEFINAKERSVLLQCGIGFGKSYVGALWIVLTALKYPGSKGMIVARDVPQLKMATLQELQKVFKVVGLKDGEDYEWNRSTNDIKFFNGTIVFCRGANNYNSAFRGANLSFILADEADFYKPEAWRTLKGRLRVEPELLRVVSSPNGFNHIYEDFFTNANQSTRVIEATTYDNPTLSLDYIDDLKRSLSPKAFEQEVLGKRLNLNVGAVYNEFSRERHVKPCRGELSPKDQLYFFTDYNVSHYCGVYVYRRNNHLYFIGEEHLEFKTTEDMARVVYAKYGSRGVIVAGDSAGNNKRGTEVQRTNYQIFRDHGLMTMPFKNPYVDARIINANSNLHHGNITIDPSCKNLIRDLELVSWKEDGTAIDKADLSLTHASDAWSYAVYALNPVFGRTRSTVSSSRM